MRLCLIFSRGFSKYRDFIFMFLHKSIAMFTAGECHLPVSMKLG